MHCPETWFVQQTRLQQTIFFFLTKEANLLGQQRPRGRHCFVISVCRFQKSLQVLNVSGNRLDSIEELTVLRNLHQFSAAENQLSDMKEMVHCLTSWTQLWKLDLQGNPLCSQPKYRDRLIIMSPRLGSYGALCAQLFASRATNCIFVFEKRTKSLIL